MEKPELEIKIRDVDYGPKLKDAFFGIGIMIASSIISYAIVNGKWRGCLDFYHIMDGKVALLKK